MKRDQDETMVAFPINIPYIMLVEGDEGIASLLHTAFTHEMNWGTMKLSTVSAALRTVRVIKPELFVIDHHLPDGDGIALYDHLHANPTFANIPAIIVSTHRDECLDRSEKRKLPCLIIPCEMHEIIQTCQNVLTSARKLN